MDGQSSFNRSDSGISNGLKARFQKPPAICRGYVKNGIGHACTHVLTSQKSRMTGQCGLCSKAERATLPRTVFAIE